MAISNRLTNLINTGEIFYSIFPEESEVGSYRTTQNHQQMLCLHTKVFDKSVFLIWHYSVDITDCIGDYQFSDKNEVIKLAKARYKADKAAGKILNFPK